MAADKFVKGGISLLIFLFILTISLMGYNIYSNYVEDQEPNGLIRDRISIPTEATNLKDIGNSWYTFDYQGDTFILHKKVRHLEGTQVESLAVQNKKHN